jgi:F0F1-type ATP synthase membrane subunit b/b'
MSLDDLQAQLRGALDQQFAALKAHYEHAIAEARQQAQTDAEHELQAKLVTARAEWEEQLNAQVSAVRAELEQERDEAVLSAKRSAELEFEAERRRAVRDIETERERSNSILEEAKHAVEGERQRARSEIDNERQRAANEIDTERQRAANEIDTQRQRASSEIDSERQRAASELEAVRAELHSEIASAREAAAKEAAAAAAARVSLATRAAASASASAASLAMYDRVATGIRTLDLSTTLGALLDALVASAGTIAGRAALFIISGDRLKAWKAAGIPDVDVQIVESSIGGRDLLARGIQAGQPIVSGPEHPAPPFARLAPDRTGLAVPLMIAGRAVAVLYVDGGAEGTSTPSEWQGAVDLLARHASALLALRTAMRTFDMIRGASDHGANGDGGEEGARRYAKLLVSEIKLYNEGAVRDGRQQRDLLRRLASEIERAQRVYEERVPPAVSARDTYFKQELVQTLAEGDETLLGS